MNKPLTAISILFNRIHLGDKGAFDELFFRYYSKLVVFAAQYVKRTDIAEELISELFLKIWLKRESLQIDKPDVYLYRSAKNGALNFIRDNKKRNHDPIEHDREDYPGYGIPNSSKMEIKELERILDDAVAALPEQCRIIFTLVKTNGIKAKDTAEILNISQRTVENQLYKALKKLADTLSPYLGYNPQNRRFSKRSTDLPKFFFLF